MNDHETYENPLTTRYASRAMAEVFSDQKRFSTWRRIWIALAEAEAELGLEISAAQLAEMRNAVEMIDFAKAQGYEKKFRHDVMAHVHTFGDAAPAARGIIHLGATSCDITDNTDIILLREALELLADGLGLVIARLAKFAREYRSLPTLGFTHFQAAQLTTVGKRACLWLEDLVLDWQELKYRLTNLPLRGIKGTTGTQASFLELFAGDHAKVKELERLVTEKLGFRSVFPVTGQTYSRKLDTQILDLLSGIASSAHKFATDLRLLAHRKEVEEPFESEQIGSSAMAYKRNPMRSERICSLARFVMGLPAMAGQTHAVQWMERTLDDSACRRIYLPQAFLGVDGILRLYANVAAGLVVHPKVIEKGLHAELPFMATENIMMSAVRAGGDRQHLHEKIRQHSLAAGDVVKRMGGENDLLQRLRQDSDFAKVDWPSVLDPTSYVGRSAEQVDEFIGQVVQPILDQMDPARTLDTSIHV